MTQLQRPSMKYTQQIHEQGELLRDQLLRGEIPDYAERETWKEEYKKVLKRWENGEAKLEELIRAVNGRLKAWYFRSAEKLPLLHPSFPVFVAMLLNEDHIIRLFPPEAVEDLVAQYGRRAGHIDGSYWLLGRAV